MCKNQDYKCFIFIFPLHIKCKEKGVCEYIMNDEDKFERRR